AIACALVACGESDPVQGCLSGVQPTTLAWQVGGDTSGVFGSTSGFLVDDGVVLANGGDWSLRRYAWSGRLEAKVGQLGSGPAEFRQLSRVAPMPGDSILVYDGELSRLSVFDRDGRFARNLGVEPVPYGSVL